jgi:hypothetical protein
MTAVSPSTRRELASFDYTPDPYPATEAEAQDMIDCLYDNDVPQRNEDANQDDDQWGHLDV